MSHQGIQQANGKPLRLSFAEKGGATRRQLLFGLPGFALTTSTMVAGTMAAGSEAAASSADSADAAATADFLEISRTLTGSTGLPADVASRIQRLLETRQAAFSDRCSQLLATMRAAGPDRDARLAALSEDEVAFALQIAKPWYVGHVGEPSAQGFDDGAEFATFLHAQGSEKIMDVVPRTTYPQRRPGWWSSPPPGVDAPSMPREISGWAFQPETPEAIRAPAPQWRAYANANFDTLPQAREARPRPGRNNQAEGEP